jgi:pyridinium-3,5-bisthiocarboxylic acid mononucleotide nickel chelatase
MILWLNPVAGLSGDMLLGALIDLGTPVDAMRAAIASTRISGWQLHDIEVNRGGLRARHAQVELDQAGHGRSGAELIAIAASATPAPVGQLAAAAVRAIAETEALIHGSSVDQVHLHELGGLDTLVDTIGVAAALHALGVTQVWSAPLALGSGVVDSAHGRLPVPAPATMALLAGAHVTGLGQVGETVTPTGAALLLAMGCQYGPIPEMRIIATGYGAGTRQTPGYPNVLPAVLGAATLADDDGGGTEPLAVLETTVDDVTGELLGTIPGQLIASGAVDSWLTAVTGKKGRPAYVITALCRPAAADAVRSALLAETGSLGARLHVVQRYALPRTATTVTVAGHSIRVKLGPHGAKPEHDDVAAAALATGIPLRLVAEEARAAFASLRSSADLQNQRSHHPQPPPRPRRGPGRNSSACNGLATSDDLAPDQPS